MTNRKPRPCETKLDVQRDEDEEPVVEADEIEEVHEQPRCPGGEAAEPQAFHIGDRGGAADCCQVALVAIVERLGSRAASLAWSSVPHIAPSASRRGQPREGRSIPAEGTPDRTMSPSAKTSGWPGSVRSGSTVTRPARSLRRRSAHRARPARLDAGPRRPRQRCGSRSARRCGCRPRRSRSSRRFRPRSAEHADAELLERLLCLRRERGREGGQHPVGGLDEQDPRRARVDRAGVARSVSRASSAICPAMSTPVGPAPTTTKVSPPSAARDGAPTRPPRRRRGVGSGL